MNLGTQLQGSSYELVLFCSLASSGRTVCVSDCRSRRRLVSERLQSSWEIVEKKHLPSVPQRKEHAGETALWGEAKTAAEMSWDFVM